MKQKAILPGLIILLLIIFVGCGTDQNPMSSDQNSLAKKADYPAFSGLPINGGAILWADHNINAGSVTFGTGTLTVTTNELYDIRGINVYIWHSLDDVPVLRPNPGHADYSIESIHASDYTLDIENFGEDDYITVHVALENGTRAYAGGEVYALTGFPDQFHSRYWWGYLKGGVAPR